MIIRVQKDKNNPYVIINKEFLNDKNLSWQEKGLLTYLLSLPDDWKINIKDLSNRSSNGKEATGNCIKNLVQKGYIKRTKKYKDRSKFDGYNYVVYEKPYPGNPCTEKPDTENQKLLSNKDNKVSKDTYGETIVSPTPSFETHSIVEFWNDLSIRKHKKPESKVYQNSIKIIKRLKAGTFHRFYQADHDFIKKNNIDESLFRKKWTDKEIQDTIKTMSLFFVSGYYPLKKEILPKDLPTLFFNERTGFSWFMKAASEPPVPLVETVKAKPKNLKIYNMYHQFYAEHIKTAKQENQFILLLNELIDEQAYIYSSIGKYYTHTSFSTHFGTDKHILPFFKKHCEYIKQMDKKYISSMTVLKTSSNSFKNFISDFEKKHGFKLYPSTAEIKALKRDHERALRRMK